MNLKCSWLAPARCSIATMSLRAAAGSRNSSTNFIAVPYWSDDGRGVEGVHFGGVGIAEFLDRGQGQQRLGLVDLRHRESDVDQHPVVGFGHVVFQQSHADGALHAADI